LFWRRIPWESVAGVQETARVDLLGWVESFYTVYRWRTVAGRRRIRRQWHRKQVRAFRFSGHIRNCPRLLARIKERAAGEGRSMAGFEAVPEVVHEAVSDDATGQQDSSPRTSKGLAGDSGWNLVIALALFALALVVYLLTLAPGPLGGDAGEFQAAARVWGLSHPTGYPLYMVLLKVWALLPIGSVAYRANLLAAVLAAAATGLFFSLLQLITRQTLGSVVGALMLAFSPLFWSQAVIADKYALNALLIAGVLAAAAYWGQAPGRRRLCLLVLVYGLSLAHHRTMLLFAPGLAIYVLWLDRGLWRDRRNWLALVCLALPLVLYAYLPLTRAFGRPLSNWWPWSPAEWLAYLTARGHLGEAQTAVAPLAERLAFYGRTLVDQFTWWGLLLSLAGWLWLLRHGRPLFALLLVSFGLEAATSMAYYADPRNQAFFLPSLPRDARPAAPGPCPGRVAPGPAAGRSGPPPGRIGPGPGRPRRDRGRRLGAGDAAALQPVGRGPAPRRGGRVSTGAPGGGGDQRATPVRGPQPSRAGRSLAPVGRRSPHRPAVRAGLGVAGGRRATGHRHG
jgi:hypothetical protein